MQHKYTYNIADAAKRRSLPAWIRDGLEKMDREKQKEEDKKLKAQQALVATESKSSDNGMPSKSKFVCIPFTILLTQC